MTLSPFALITGEGLIAEAPPFHQQADSLPVLKRRWSEASGVVQPDRETTPTGEEIDLDCGATPSTASVMDDVFVDFGDRMAKRPSCSSSLGTLDDPHSPYGGDCEHSPSPSAVRPTPPTFALMREHDLAAVWAASAAPRAARWWEAANEADCCGSLEDHRVALRAAAAAPHPHAPPAAAAAAAPPAPAKYPSISAVWDLQPPDSALRVAEPKTAGALAPSAAPPFGVTRAKAWQCFVVGMHTLLGCQLQP